MLRLLVMVTMLHFLLGAPGGDGAAALKRGELLRLHVVAESDEAAAQALKQPVWDAVHSTYARLAPEDAPTLPTARALLPELTAAAQDAARASGFGGEVAVSLETAAFDARMLEGMVVPAGTYPALMVRLGAAQGHNCWGLLDPESSLRAACAGEDGRVDIIWDWSLGALWEALFGWRPVWLGGA